MAEAAQAAADAAQALADVNAANMAAMQNNLAALVAAVAQQALHPPAVAPAPVGQQGGQHHAGVGGGRKRLEPFESANGVEWLTWRRVFAVTAQINGWFDDRQRLEVRASMKGAAERAIADIEHDPPVVAAAFTVQHLLDAYQARFLPEAETDICRVALKNAMQTDGENVLEWHTRARALYARAYPNRGADEVELRDLFNLGLRDKKIKEATWKARPQTYTECLTAAHNEAAARAVLDAHSGIRSVKQEPGGLHAFGSQPPQYQRRQPGPPDQGEGCRYCGAPGHFRRECRKYTEALKGLDEQAPIKKGKKAAAGGEAAKSKGKFVGKFKGKGKGGDRGVNAVEQSADGGDEQSDDQGNY